MFGTITRVSPRGFGFIRINGEQREVYFHVHQLRDLAFGDWLVGERVDFEEGDTAKGDCAFNVRPAEF